MSTLYEADRFVWADFLPDAPLYNRTRHQPVLRVYWIQGQAQIDIVHRPAHRWDDDAGMESSFPLEWDMDVDDFNALEAEVNQRLSGVATGIRLIPDGMDGTRAIYSVDARSLRNDISQFIEQAAREAARGK